MICHVSTGTTVSQAPSVMLAFCLCTMYAVATVCKDLSHLAPHNEPQKRRQGGRQTGPHVASVSSDMRQNESL